MPERFLCIHAHFYQPPRENPWLETVESQQSAYPYHDWNERITAECYAPIAASRVLNAADRIVRIANTYSRISFNFGPTLLSWMEQHAARVYEAVLEADRASMQQFSGHGSALAQVYNHMILPLANPRDKLTQIRWGIRDFEKRFARRPEGMWLAETAVDLETLEALAECGIKFTVLAPHQAARVRLLGPGNNDWQDVGQAQIDPTTAYLQRLPSGREISLFFYDGPISRAVAFEGLLNNGEGFAERLMSGYSREREWPQLMHIATDGETYGHHHKYGDMALTYALEYITQNGLAQITNYGEFLERFPPRHEVAIAQNTSWSCAHGVERWRSDCGCCSGGRAGWDQQWRTPLRGALDWLRDRITPLYEEAASPLLKDCWQARDEYACVVLQRSPESMSAFFCRAASRQLNAAERTRALKLLEMQRHAMLMYTSCGWFFDELTGLETMQVLQYAGRVIQLAEEVFGAPFEDEFLTRLASARSNLPEHGSGREVYLKWVKPMIITLRGVGAHFAISSLFQRHAETAPTYCYSVARLDYDLAEAGRARMALGRALISSRVTEESECVAFAVLHFGDNNLSAGVVGGCERKLYEEIKERAFAVFRRFDLAGAVRLLDGYFPPMHYSLRSLFRDEQRRIVNAILENVMSEAEASHRNLYAQHAPLLRFLADLRIPQPKILEVSAEFVINGGLRREFQADEPDLDRVRTLLISAESEKVTLDSDGLAYALRKTLERGFTRLLEAPTDLGLLAKTHSLLEMAVSLPFPVSLWKTQNSYYQLLQSVYPVLRDDPSEEAHAWTERFLQLGELLGFAVNEAAPKPVQNAVA